MATTGIVNGTNLRWFINGTAVAEAITGSISFSKETRQVANKDSTGGWAQSIGGRKSFTGSVESHKTEAGSMDTFWAAYNDDTVLDMEWTTGVTGDKYFDCQVKIVNIEETGTHEEEVIYTVSFEGYGQPTRATEA